MGLPTADSLASPGAQWGQDAGKESQHVSSNSLHILKQEMGLALHQVTAKVLLRSDAQGSGSPLLQTHPMQQDARRQRRPRSSMHVLVVVFASPQYVLLFELQVSP